MLNQSLFPAHAGVIPLTPTLRTWKTTFPRTRGGDPTAIWT